MKKLILVMALFLLTCGMAWAQGRTGDEVFFKANRDYREGRFAEAARGYGELVASGRADGHVYYNLGNAMLKLNRPGKAILNYERARLMIPRDADLAFNLSMALDKSSDAAGPPAQAFSSVFFWLQSFSLPELFWLFAGFHVFLFASAALWLFRRTDWSYYLLMVCLFAWFSGALSYGMRYYEIATDRRAVVVSATADALAGPEAGDTVLFRLREGAYVTRERSESSWVLVSLPGGKRGWMKASDVEGILDGNLRARLIPF